MNPVPPHSTRKRPQWQEANAAGRPQWQEANAAGRPQWQEAASMLALFGVLSAIVFWPQVGQGRALYWGDIGLYFRPLGQFLHDQLQRGRLPLWNPYTLCGTPFVGNPQASPFYPPALWLTGAGGADTWINGGAAFHAMLAGWGAYLLLRVGQGRGLWAALLGGTTFAFGGELVSKAQFPNMLAATAWLPFALLCVKRWAKSVDNNSATRAGVGLGVTFGLQLLAAHAQITLLTLYLCAAYGLAQLLPPAPSPSEREGEQIPPGPLRKGEQIPPGPLRKGEQIPPGPLRKGEQIPPGPLRKVQGELSESPSRSEGGGLGGGLLLACALAVGLSAVQVLPDAAALHDAWRQRLSFPVVNRFTLPVDQMGNWILPLLHGHPTQGTFTGRGNFWETCCYVGVVPFALALVGAWTGRRERETRFWAGTFVAGVWLATGGAGGLYHLAYWVLPGVRAFHDPARCLVLAAFALSVLAARGLDTVRWKPFAQNPSPSLPKAGKAKKAPEPPRMGEQDFFRLPYYWGRGGAWCAALALLAFTDLARFDQTVYPLAPVNTLNPVSPNVAMVQSDPDVQSGQARLMAPDTARVWQRFTGHRAYRGDAPSYQTLWADTLTPNLPFAYPLRDAWGYEPVARRDATAFAGDADNALRGSQPDGAWAGVLGVKYVALCRVRVPAGGSLRVIRAAPTLAALGEKGPPPPPKFGGGGGDGPHPAVRQCGLSTPRPSNHQLHNLPDAGRGVGAAVAGRSSFQRR